MHGLVLEHGKRGLSPVEERMAGLFEGGVRECVEDVPVGFLGEALDDVAVGPPVSAVARRRWPVAGGFVWIDAAREQRLEPRVDARSAEAALHERVEAEGR